MTLPDWFLEATAWLAPNRWVLWVFLIVIGAGIVELIQRRILHRLRRKAEETENLLDDILLEALVRPISLVIWVFGITVAAEVTRQAMGTESVVFEYVGEVRRIGIIIALAWFLLRLIRGAEHRMIEQVRTLSLTPEEGMDRSTVEAFAKLFRAAVVVTAGLLLLQTLGYSISGVLAFGGVAGIAIGFAARDLLANFFGGIMIHMDRPLAVGEWVRSPDREIEGTVEFIGWRISRIRTFDMRPLYVPNSIFSTIIVENPSRMSHRRIYETIGLRYDDIAVVGAIAADLRELLQGREEIDQEQTQIVNFLRFGESSLDIMVYCLLTEKRWAPYHAIKEEILLEIARIVEQHGAQVAFPTSTLHVETLPGGEPDDGSGGGAEQAARAARRASAGQGRHGGLEGGSATEGGGE